MKIYEEYLLRNNINIDIIPHHRFINLFFEYNKIKCILYCKWVGPVYHPGYYQFQYYRVVKGMVTPDFLEKTKLDFLQNPEINFSKDKLDHVKVYFDQYPDYIVKVLNFLKTQCYVPKTPVELHLFKWEMILSNVDVIIPKLFESQDSKEFIENAYKSLDKTLESDIRYKAAQIAFQYVSDYSSDLRKLLNHYTEGYSNWLADLHSKELVLK